MSEFKPNGYKQTSPGAVTFSKKLIFGGKTYEKTVNVKSGGFTLTDVATGNQLAEFDAEKNKYNDPITSTQKDFVKNITSTDTGNQWFNKNLIQGAVSDTKSIGDKVLDDRTASGISEEAFNEKDLESRNQYSSFSSTVDEQGNEGGIGPINVGDEIDNLNGEMTASNKSPNFKSLYYPKTLKKNEQQQDYIKFTVGKYNIRTLKNDQNKLGRLKSLDDSFKGTGTVIYLPIQPSIVDSNTVGWNEDKLNPVQVAGLQAIGNFAEEGGAGLRKTLDQLKNTLGEDNSALLSAGKLLLAQEAVGAQNVLSRFGGAVLNPNLELLFNGPQLRPFSFNFRLSPRDEKEAQDVKIIIRAFKNHMAVKKTTGLFLAVPDIFKIEYIQGGTGRTHPSMNRFKNCALKACAVNYAPENTYMTFGDTSNTMVSYNLSLEFQELEPVTDADYAKLDQDVIGF